VNGDDTSVDDIIRDSTVSRLTAEWCGWKLGDMSWYRAIKAVEEALAAADAAEKGSK
jgi:hypothetical protein